MSDTVDVNVDAWFPIHVRDSAGAPVTGLTASSFTALRFNKKTANGTVQQTIVPVDTASADYEVNETGFGDYEVMVPATASGSSTAANDAECTAWVSGTVTGGSILIEKVQVVDPADADKLSSFVGTLDGTGHIQSGTFAVGALDAVWSTATRLLTAGTNIALTKGVGLLGLNDLSAAEVNAEADTALADYDPPTKAELDSGLANLNDLSAADLRSALYPAEGTAQSGADEAITVAVGDGAAIQARDVIVLTGGTGAGQVNVVQGVAGDIVTVVAAWETNPDGTTQYAVLRLA